MFQNVASVDFKQILKNIFNINNIVIYILAFLVSSNWTTFEYSLLGISFMAAALSADIPLVGVIIATLVGAFVGHGVAGGVAFIAIMLVFFVLTLLFRPKVSISDRNEGLKLGSRVFWSCLIILTAKDLSQITLFASLFFAFIDSSIVYAFYKIFVNGIVVIRDVFDKKVFTVEEYLGVVALVSVAFAMSAFRLDRLGNVGIIAQNVIIAVMLMWIGLKNNMLVSLMAGLVCGLATITVNSSLASYTIVYMIACFAGSLRKQSIT